MDEQAKATLECIDWDKVGDDLGGEIVCYCLGLMNQGRYWEAEDYLQDEIEADHAMHYPGHSGIG